MKHRNIEGMGSTAATGSSRKVFHPGGMLWAFHQVLGTTSSAILIECEQRCSNFVSS